MHYLSPESYHTNPTHQPSMRSGCQEELRLRQAIKTSFFCVCISFKQERLFCSSHAGIIFFISLIFSASASRPQENPLGCGVYPLTRHCLSRLLTQVESLWSVFFFFFFLITGLLINFTFFIIALCQNTMRTVLLLKPPQRFWIRPLCIQV